MLQVQLSDTTVRDDRGSSSKRLYLSHDTLSQPVSKHEKRTELGEAALCYV